MRWRYVIVEMETGIQEGPVGWDEIAKVPAYWNRGSEDGGAEHCPPSRRVGRVGGWLPREIGVDP